MLTLSDEIYSAVGRVVVGTAYLDHELAGIVNRLLDSSHGQLLIAGQPYSHLDRVAKVLGSEILEPELYESLRDLLTEAANLHEQRDLVVHGIWLPHQDDVDKLFDPDFVHNRHLAVRPRRWKLSLHGKVVTLEGVRKLASDIEDLANRMGYFLANQLPRPTKQS